MNFRPATVAVIATTFLLCACVPISQSPLSSPDAAQPDPKLIGSWHPVEDSDETYVITVKDAHWMHIVDEKKSLMLAPQTFDAFVTIIGSNRFLNVRQQQKDARGNMTTIYYLVRYQVSGRHLWTWWIDEAKAAAAVRSGKLSGTVTTTKGMISSKPDYDIRITDSGSKILALLRKEGADSLFGTESDDFVRAGR